MKDEPMQDYETWLRENDYDTWCKFYNTEEWVGRADKRVREALREGWEKYLKYKEKEGGDMEKHGMGFRFLDGGICYGFADGENGTFIVGQFFSECRGKPEEFLGTDDEWRSSMLAERLNKLHHFSLKEWDINRISDEAIEKMDLKAVLELQKWVDWFQVRIKKEVTARGG